MATVFRLPDIGEGLTEAEIVEWHAEVGDAVVADRPLVTVETDKTQADLPAPITGVLLFRGAAAGETLEVGAVLAVVGKEGERWPEEDDDDDWSLMAVPDETFEMGDLRRDGDLIIEQEELDDSWGLASPPPAPPERQPVAAVPGTGAPRALPLVRRLAKEHGIDLARITGTGPGGRILRADLEMVIAASASSLPTTAPPVPATQPAERPPLVGTLVEEAEDLTPPPRQQPTPVKAQAPSVEGDHLEPLSATRRAIAEHMTRSWREIPHVTSFGSFDASRLLDVRRALGARHGVPVPLDALLVKAVVPALAAFPEFNSVFTDDGVLYRGDRHIGMAVNADDGLLVAVVRHADRLPILDLAGEVARLSEAAKSRRLAREEMAGATFTVSNIGAVGGATGTPIIPHGTAAILSVGRAEDTPVVRDGAVTIAPIAPVSLSYDHRIIDGATGRRFMAMLTENLEEPALFLS